MKVHFAPSPFFFHTYIFFLIWTACTRSLMYQSGFWELVEKSPCSVIYVTYAFDGIELTSCSRRSEKKLKFIFNAILLFFPLVDNILVPFSLNYLNILLNISYEHFDFWYRKKKRSGMGWRRARSEIYQISFQRFWFSILTMEEEELPLAQRVSRVR